MRAPAIIFATPDELSDRARRAGLLAILPTEEKTRLSRLHIQARRDLFLLAHGVLRESLSIHSHVEPAEWRFHCGPHGRPEITPSFHLRFSLSHTRGLAACAVTVGGDIGIDVEDTSRCWSAGLAQRYFAVKERRDLQALPAADQRFRFFEYWTLKEAYLKARGVGLALPLDAFSFSRCTDNRWQIEFDSTVDDDARRWRFESWRVGGLHQAALAMASNESPIAPQAADVNVIQ